jgi:siroheme synthase (precorrin-2 oxidase/ferrochelatase)
MSRRRPGLAVSLYVESKRCVVVGEGALADERIARLAEAGANVEQVATLAWCAEMARGAALVLAIDADRADEVTRDARAAGALAYALDQPERSDLAMPAIARRGPLQIAVTTDAQAPALSRRLRAELQRLLDEAGPELDGFIADLEAGRAAMPPGRERREALQQRTERLSIEGKLTIVREGDAGK